jgi:UDP:flavonoid glycosyltransferase YjiC (YdhE family)
MRVLITTTGFTGHVLPLAPLAEALLAAGHEVLVAAPQRRHPTADALGAPLASVGEPSDDTIAPFHARIGGLSARDAQPLVIADGFTRARAGAALDDLDAIVADVAPDLIVRESHELAGAVVAARHGVPHVRVALGTAAGEADVMRFAGLAVDQLAARLGLSSGVVPRALRAAPAITFLPPALDPPLPGAPVHRFALRERRPARLGGPLVYASLGTIAGSMPAFAGLHRRVADALAGLDAEVIVSAGDPRSADPRLDPWVDEPELLRRASVMVTHGGHGSVLGALAQGVPLVVVPLFASDQWDNADAVERSGAGIAVRGFPRRTFDPPGDDVFAALPGAAQQLLETGETRRAAHRVADQIGALPDIARAVELLDRVADRRASHAA